MPDWLLCISGLWEHPCLSLRSVVLAFLDSDPQILQHICPHTPMTFKGILVERFSIHVHVSYRPKESSTSTREGWGGGVGGVGVMVSETRALSLRHVGHSSVHTLGVPRLPASEDPCLMRPAEESSKHPDKETKLWHMETQGQRRWGRDGGGMTKQSRYCAGCFYGLPH